MRKDLNKGIKNNYGNCATIISFKKRVIACMVIEAVLEIPIYPH